MAGRCNYHRTPKAKIQSAAPRYRGYRADTKQVLWIGSSTADHRRPFSARLLPFKVMTWRGLFVSSWGGPRHMVARRGEPGQERGRGSPLISRLPRHVETDQSDGGMGSDVSVMYRM
ncbi:unnamed protein product [Lota lota]